MQLREKNSSNKNVEDFELSNCPEIGTN